jgi:hypothetical protein
MKNHSQINPFIRNPLMQDRVSLDELLVAVEKVTNRGYMPTATGERTVNSKPEYVSREFKTIDLHGHEHIFPQVEAVERSEPYSDYYTFEHHHEPQQMFFYLSVSYHQIVINLRTLRAAIRLHGSNFPDQNFLDWPRQSEWPAGSNMRLSLDRFELHKLGLEL